MARYAGDADLQRLRRWRYDDPRDETAKSLYEPFWRFLVEMPLAARADQEKNWTKAVGVLFEHRAPRCCEMIYRAWPALRRTSRGRKVIRDWQDEFRQICRAEGSNGEIARKILVGLRTIPKGDCPYGADSSQGIEGELMSVASMARDQRDVRPVRFWARRRALDQ